MNEPEPNPHIATNNARQEGWDAHVAAHNRRNQGALKLVDTQSVRLKMLEALDDKSRLDWLIEHGATWAIPFVKDGPLDFHRGTIDHEMRQLL